MIKPFNDMYKFFAFVSGKCEPLEGKKNSRLIIARGGYAVIQSIIAITFAYSFFAYGSTLVPGLIVGVALSLPATLLAGGTALAVVGGQAMIASVVQVTLSQFAASFFYGCGLFISGVACMHYYRAVGFGVIDHCIRDKLPSMEPPRALGSA